MLWHPGTSGTRPASSIPGLLPSQDSGGREGGAPEPQNQWLSKGPTTKQAVPLCPFCRQSWRTLVLQEGGLESGMSPAPPDEGGESLGWVSAGTQVPAPPALLPALSLAGAGQPVPGAGAGLPAAHLADPDVPAGHGLQQHHHPPGPHGNRHFPRPPGVAPPRAGEEQTGCAATKPRGASTARERLGQQACGRQAALGRRCRTCKGCCFLIY